ncbi:MAG TPA: sulfate ABC transporter ATP-binding protein [Elusimicrobiota bacterium]|nr:sulfate ABC transporter ATP-binding protein [Elusimicrobiota bacterium]
MSIEVRGLTKRFGAFKAVDDVSFRLESGSLVALLGPSGSGKSTLLRMIAGLERPDAGDILLTGEEATTQSARQRNVGFVFQHYALFKHMTIWDNIAFGLAVRGTPGEEIRERVRELLKLVQLEGYENRFPSQLSGGQRQRVALARALAPRPRVLLLDEPFGALDAKVRDELRGWIRRLHEEAHVTTLFVTHDQQEAMEISGKILVMAQGRIEQEGTPFEIFDHPATQFVAQFVGETNHVDSVISQPELALWGPFRFTVAGPAVGAQVRIYFRPNDVYLSSVPETLQVEGTIVKTRFRGPLIEHSVDVGADRPIVAHVPKGVSLASGFDVGRRVYVGITAYHSFAVPAGAA